VAYRVRENPVDDGGLIDTVRETDARAKPMPAHWPLVTKE